MAQLTDQEKQEIIRYLEADKALPDKYRFFLFEEKREVELVWNGKSNEVTNIVLPFQTIEQVDEPRAENDRRLQLSLFDTDSRGRQLKGWTNKLIWGDNKLILSSLKNGPMRQEIEEQGGLKLIYIDPPFDVGADFSMDIEIGVDTFTKRPNILEEIAYRDTWGKGADSFNAMIYERLQLMHSLLANDGSIYVHCDWRLTAHMRMVMDELFGEKNFINEIIWSYPDKLQGNINGLPKNHDTILFYKKENKFTWNGVKIELDKPRRINARVWNPATGRLDTKKDEHGNVIYNEYTTKNADDVWIIPQAEVTKRENTGYPTEKPESLIERIIKASSNEGELIGDFFAGSGTTLAVAEKLGRKWIGCDLGKFAIHTARKRMIEVQRKHKAEDKPYRAFELLNLGKYERQHYVGVNPNLRDEEKQRQIEVKEAEFLMLILTAYRAEPINGFRVFTGKKAGRLVAVGPINLPVTRNYVDEIIDECLEKQITKCDILAFEFEMGLFPNVLDEAKSKGIDIAPKYIPAEVFDKRAVERNQVVFHDVAFVELTPHVKGKNVSVELTDFSVYYTQDSIQFAEETVRNGGSKIVVEAGQIVKVSKDKKGIVTREVLTKNWIDWVDYWAVDFNFENKKEIIRIQNPETKEWEERWTGDYVFENEWQSFRTKKDRKLELVSVAHECEPGRRKLAVKVVDIFGNDTMKIVEVNIGKK